MATWTAVDAHRPLRDLEASLGLVGAFPESTHLRLEVVDAEDEDGPLTLDMVGQQKVRRCRGQLRPWPPGYPWRRWRRRPARRDRPAGRRGQRPHPGWVGTRSRVRHTPCRGRVWRSTSRRVVDGAGLRATACRGARSPAPRRPPGRDRTPTPRAPGRRRGRRRPRDAPARAPRCGRHPRGRSRRR